MAESIVKNINFVDIAVNVKNGLVRFYGRRNWMVKL